MEPFWPCLGFLIFLLFILDTLAQQAQNGEGLRPPQLKLELIPEKSTYLTSEKAKLNFRLTSLSDGTVCFPRPAFEQTGTSAGYLSIDARPLTGTGDEQYFLSGVWPRHPSEEELRADVIDRWIRVGMSEPHEQWERKPLGLDQGDWLIKASYHPPKLSAHERSIVESLGCTAPFEQTVSSDPVTIHIANSSR